MKKTRNKNIKSGDKVVCVIGYYSSHDKIDLNTHEIYTVTIVTRMDTVQLKEIEDCYWDSGRFVNYNYRNEKLSRIL
jgi:hypothetical protein